MKKGVVKLAVCLMVILVGSAGLSAQYFWTEGAEIIGLGWWEDSDSDFVTELIDFYANRHFAKKWKYADTKNSTVQAGLELAQEQLEFFYDEGVETSGLYVVNYFFEKKYAKYYYFIWIDPENPNKFTWKCIIVP